MQFKPSMIRRGVLAPGTVLLAAALSLAGTAGGATRDVTVTASGLPDGAWPKDGPFCFVEARSPQRGWEAVPLWTLACAEAARAKGLEVAPAGSAGCVQVEIAVATRQTGTRRLSVKVRATLRDRERPTPAHEILATLHDAGEVLETGTVVAACRAAFADFPEELDGADYAADTSLPPGAAALPRRRDQESGPVDFLRAYYDRVNMQLHLEPKSGSGSGYGRQVDYMTKSDWMVGGAFGSGALVLAFASTIPRPADDTWKYGRTRITASSAALELERTSVELYSYRFRGFYREDGDLTESGALPRVDAMRADLAGVTATWIRNPSAFALPGRFTSDPLPDRPGWSPLAGGRVAYVHVESPEALVPEVDRPAYGAGAGVRGFEQYKVGVGGGVGAAWVNGPLSAGAAAQVMLETDRSRFIGGQGGVPKNGFVMHSRLGLRWVGETLDLGVFGIFDDGMLESSTTKYRIRRDTIETYLLWWL